MEVLKIGLGRNNERLLKPTKNVVYQEVFANRQ